MFGPSMNMAMTLSTGRDETLLVAAAKYSEPMAAFGSCFGKHDFHWQT